jgi:hypothetical protein
MTPATFLLALALVFAGTTRAADEQLQRQCPPLPTDRHESALSSRAAPRPCAFQWMQYHIQGRIPCFLFYMEVFPLSLLE